MSPRMCFPPNDTRSAAARLLAAASAMVGATAVTASTRPPAVTNRPSVRFVPAWKSNAAPIAMRVLEDWFLKIKPAREQAAHPKAAAALKP